MDVVERVDGWDAPDLVLDDGFEVLVVNFLFLIGDFFEPLKGAVEFVVGEMESHLLEPGFERVPAGMFAENEARLGPADVLRPHDLVGPLVLEDPVLVDAGLVRERVVPDDRLVGLDPDAGERGHEPAGTEDLLCLDARLAIEFVPARLERHDDFLKRGVAGALADAVDGALDLPGAGEDGGEGIGGGEAEVVVAVDADDRAVDVGDFAADGRDEFEEFGRRRVADGVGDIDGDGAGVNDGGEDLDDVVGIRPARVLAGKFDVRQFGFGAPYRLDGHVENLLARFPEFFGDMDIAGRDERMDARRLGGLDGLVTGVDVLRKGARQSCDRHVLHLARDPRDGLEIAGAGDGEPALDDVDTEARERMRDLYFLLDIEAGAGRLLAVPEGRVENADRAAHRVDISSF